MQAVSRWIPLLLLWLTLALSGCAGSPLTISVAGDVIEVLSHGEPFATVHVDAQPRPYVWPLYGPGSVPMTRNYPMAERSGEASDHPHHQSLWLAHGNVNGFDFWHGKDHHERLEMKSMYASTDHGPYVLVQCEYSWLVDEDTEVLRETRQLRFRDDGATRSIDVISELRAVHGDVRFGDTKEGTFAMRVHPALRAEGKVATGELRNSEGHTGNAVWGKRARWIDDSGEVAGKQVGVTIFDHPENLRHPTWWHARSYGLLGANPFGAHDFAKQPVGAGDFVINKGESLKLRYRVVLHGADWEGAQIEAAYSDWLDG